MTRDLHWKLIGCIWLRELRFVVARELLSVQTHSKAVFADQTTADCMIVAHYGVQLYVLSVIAHNRCCASDSDSESKMS